MAKTKLSTRFFEKDLQIGVTYRLTFRRMLKQRSSYEKEYDTPVRQIMKRLLEGHKLIGETSQISLDRTA